MNKEKQLDLFSVFSFVWAIALLFHVIQAYAFPIITERSFLHIAFFISCLALLLRPSSTALFVISAVMVLVVGWQSFPRNISNHFIIEFILCAGIVGCWIAGTISKRQWRIDRQQFFPLVALMGRWLLLIMYFFGVFHKINTDWFNPEVSCATALWGRFFWRLPGWLEGALWAKYAAIYGTLIIETAIIAILFLLPRYSKLAVISGLLFHGMIGFNAYAQYWNFSSLSLALHFLFLPESVVNNWRNSKPYRFLSGQGYYISLVVLCVLAISILLHFHDRQLAYIYVLWAPFLFFVLAFVWRYADYSHVLQRPMFTQQLIGMPGFIVALFLLNGFSPYIGFKTESSIAMYSNLYTEAGETNHLLFSSPPYIFDYQNQMVLIEESSDKKLQRLTPAGRPILLHQLKQHIKRRYAKVKNKSITYRLNGELRRFERIADDPLLNHTNYFLYKLLVLKPLDFSRPMHCTH